MGNTGVMDLAPLLTIDIQVRPPVALGPTPRGESRVIVFEGGTFHGRDGLEGTLDPGGTDWQYVRADGVLEIDARYVLRTTDGDTIEVRSIGVRDASPDVAARIASGAPVDPDEYYFRTHIRLTTSSTTWDWLNRRVFVSNGHRMQHAVRIEVHEVR